MEQRRWLWSDGPAFFFFSISSQLTSDRTLVSLQPPSLLFEHRCHMRSLYYQDDQQILTLCYFVFHLFSSCMKTDIGSYQFVRID